MQDKWCPENDGAWRAEQSEIARVKAEELIQPFIDKIEELQEQVHFCPNCMQYCKQCECWDTSYKETENQLEAIRSELEHVECEEWCGKSPTKNDDGRCHICRIKRILEDIE